MLLLLLLLFAIKHICADWSLQTEWMVEGKRRRGLAFIPPLASHAGIHAGLTLYVICGAAFAVAQPGIIRVALGMAGIDFAAHFVMDRIKGVATRPCVNTRIVFDKTVRYETPVSGCRIKVWTVIDQMVHGMTYLGIIYLLMTKG